MQHAEYLEYARSHEPVATYTAAAGQDYGFVAAFSYGDKFIIQHGNNGETNFDVADDLDDLPGWLESPDLNPEDAIVQQANVRGSADVEEASEEDTGPFMVLQTRWWYGPTETSRMVSSDEDSYQTPLEFGSCKEAQEWIDEQESETYRLAHNEFAAPDYKIVTA
ncbi:hypothetical protein AAE485_15260 (plasmid) [Acidithiobacillus ferriphilus]|uniref:hypothetical protein n=1 Tax=Acidithiobacillus TaxID=119977 RepID=UPI0034E4A87F